MKTRTISIDTPFQGALLCLRQELGTPELMTRITDILKEIETTTNWNKLSARSMGGPLARVYWNRETSELTYELESSDPSIGRSLRRITPLEILYLPILEVGFVTSESWTSWKSTFGHAGVFIFWYDTEKQKVGLVDSAETLNHPGRKPRTFSETASDQERLLDQLQIEILLKLTRFELGLSNSEEIVWMDRLKDHWPLDAIPHEGLVWAIKDRLMYSDGERSSEKSIEFGNKKVHKEILDVCGDELKIAAEEVLSDFADFRSWELENIRRGGGGWSINYQTGHLYRSSFLWFENNRWLLESIFDLDEDGLNQKIREICRKTIFVDLLSALSPNGTRQEVVDCLEFISYLFCFEDLTTEEREIVRGALTVYLQAGSLSVATLILLSNYKQPIRIRLASGDRVAGGDLVSKEIKEYLSLFPAVYLEPLTKNVSGEGFSLERDAIKLLAEYQTRRDPAIRFAIDPCFAPVVKALKPVAREIGISPESVSALEKALDIRRGGPGSL